MNPVTTVKKIRACESEVAAQLLLEAFAAGLNGRGGSEMFCDVDKCNNLAEYLRIIYTDEGKKVNFNLCFAHNKSDWKIDKQENEGSNKRE